MGHGAVVVCLTKIARGGAAGGCAPGQITLWQGVLGGCVVMRGALSVIIRQVGSRRGLPVAAGGGGEGGRGGRSRLCVQRGAPARQGWARLIGEQADAKERVLVEGASKVAPSPLEMPRPAAAESSAAGRASNGEQIGTGTAQQRGARVCERTQHERRRGALGAAERATTGLNLCCKPRACQHATQSVASGKGSARFAAVLDGALQKVGKRRACRLPPPAAPRAQEALSRAAPRAPRAQPRAASSRPAACSRTRGARGSACRRSDLVGEDGGGARRDARLEVVADAAAPALAALLRGLGGLLQRVEAGAGGLAAGVGKVGWVGP